MYLVVVSEAAGLGPNFHRWINDISCDIRYIIKVNVFFSKPFQIECSSIKVAHCLQLGFVLFLELLLQKLNGVLRTSEGVWCGRSASADANDVSNIEADKG